MDKHNSEHFDSATLSAAEEQDKGAPEQPERPAALPVKGDSTPEDLKRLPQWVLWRYEWRGGRWTKVPYQPCGRKASSTNPKTWSAFGAVWRAYQTGEYDGIGFALSDEVDENGLTFAAIDIDKVSGDPKRIARSKEIIKAVGSYTELSPSAKGLRVFLKAKPRGSVAHDGLEFYAGKGRYLTVTGHVLKGRTDLVDAPEPFEEVISKHCPARDAGLIRAQGHINGELPSALAHSNPDLNSALSGGMEAFRWFDLLPPEDKGSCLAEGAATESFIKRADGEYNPWLNIVMAFARSGAPNAREICRKWSQASKKYVAGEFEEKFDEFEGTEGPITCGTLLKLMQDDGWDASKWKAAASQESGGSQGDEGARAGVGTDRQASAQEGWAKPTAISSKPLPVLLWEPRFLPAPLDDMVVDYADSVPMSREFVASNVLSAAGSVLSGKVRLALKQDGSWVETPNAWTLNIAPPSAMKTPGLQLCNDALKCIEGYYEQKYQLELATHDGQMIAYETAVGAIRAAAKKGTTPMPLPPKPEPPVLQRAVTNDSTPEKLGDIIRGGPIAVVLDEAAGLLAQLADPKNQAARAFYNAAYNGNQPYKVDRITRGSINVPCLGLSIIGNIQPERLMQLALGAARDGRQDDGFMQRFGMMTMPDPVHHTELVDNTYDLFKYIPGRDALVGLKDYDPAAHGAKDDSMFGNGLPCFKLSDDAMKLWQAEYKRQRVEIGDIELMAAYRQHVAKIPKVITTVALAIHAIEGHHGDISGPVMERAIAAGRFYLSHAKRVYYMTAHDVYAEPAKVIAARVARGEIAGEFTSRDAYTNGWAGCYDAERTEAIMELLEDTYWVRSVAGSTTPRGGRPTKRWQVNPLARGANY